jgi:hypothetical protein
MSMSRIRNVKSPGKQAETDDQKSENNSRYHIQAMAELKLRRRLILLSNVDIGRRRILLEHITRPSRR